MDNKKIRILNETGHYLSVPRGISMKPMLKNTENVVDIVPIKDNLKKYDVALYYRPTDNKYVLHRILEVYDDHCIFYGDNCWQKEYVKRDMVIGVAERFYKNGKWIPVTDKKYMAYVRIWCAFLPLRKIVFRIRDKIKYYVRKVEKSKHKHN